MREKEEVNFEFLGRCDYIININPKTKKNHGNNKSF